MFFTSQGMSSQNMSSASSADLPVGPEADILNRLREAINQFVAGNLDASEFDALLVAHDFVFWQTLQNGLDSHTQAYADVCCALAYLGKDYEENQLRLMLPYHVFLYDAMHYVQYHEADTEAAHLEDLPGYLALLYRKHRRPETLAVLLELDLNDHPAYLEYVSAMASLWELRAAALLRCASQNRLRRSRLTRALATVCCTVDEPTVWRSYFRDLQRLVYTRNHRLMKCARRIIAGLKRAQRRC